MSAHCGWGRRGVVLGAVAVLAGGAALNWRRLFAKHYPPTPYDDVLSRLTDREWAAKFGRLALKTMPGFSAADTAARLRRQLGHDSLAAAANRDAVQGRLSDVQGWLVPESVALTSALAAALS